jgi:hypothetical protein
LCHLAVQGRKEIDLIPRKAAGQKGLTHSSAKAPDADEKAIPKVCAYPKSIPKFCFATRP